MPAMALLDRDGVYGAPRFHHGGKEEWDQSPYRGRNHCPKSYQSPKSKVQSPKSKQALDIGPLDLGPEHSFRKATMTIPVLVRNRTGYQNLCRLITLMKLRVPKHAKPGECAVTTR